MRVLFGAALALSVALVPSSASRAAICKTIEGAWVGFGENGTRKEAEDRLDKEIAAYGVQYRLTPVKSKDRKVSCHIYIEFLNEYECTANAVVCR